LKFTLNDGTAGERGYGPGLALGKQLVGKLQGKIHIMHSSSLVGGGTRFEIVLLRGNR